jgi:hypothetical protein
MRYQAAEIYVGSWVMRLLMLAITSLFMIGVNASKSPPPPPTDEQLARTWVGIEEQGWIWKVTFAIDGTGRCIASKIFADKDQPVTSSYKIYQWRKNAYTVQFACRGIDGTDGRRLFKADFVGDSGTLKDMESTSITINVVPLRDLEEQLKR